jgi:hypothetical protein
MPVEYRVVSAETLTEAVSLWQMPAARSRAYAAELQSALNRMAEDGWRLVESHKEPWSGALLFVFEREAAGEQRVARERHEEHRNGIRPAKPGARE